MILFWEKYKNKIFTVLLVLVFILGIAIRTSFFIQNNAFEDDECRLILSLMDKHWWQLFLPLGLAQSAPPLLILPSKFLGTISGYEEHAMHIIPYLFSIASLFMFGKICLSYFNKKISTILCLFIFSISNLIVYYSSIFKQYGCDVLCGLFCLYFFPKININQLSKKQFIILTLSIIALPLISLPSLFFIGALLLQNIINNFKNKEFYKKLAILILPFILFMGIYYFFNLLPSKADLNYHFPNYWKDSLGNYSLIHCARLFIVNIKFLFFPNKYILCTLILFIYGAILSFRRKDSMSIFMLLTTLIVLIALFFNIYPFVGRISLYYASIALLFIFNPLDKVKIKSFKSVFIIFMLIFGFWSYNFSYLKSAFNQESYCSYSPKTLMLALIEKFNPEDSILVNNASASSYLFYSRKFNFYTPNIFEMRGSSKKPEVLNEFLNSINRQKGTWFYLIKDYSTGDEMYSILLPWFEKQGAELIKQENKSYLYYLKAGD